VARKFYSCLAPLSPRSLIMDGRSATDTIVFVYSDQPGYDRGWETAFVERELLLLGLRVLKFRAIARSSTKTTLLKLGSNVLYWPVCYTIGPDVGGPLLVDLLRELELAYVGASPSSFELNSKILLKERLAQSGISTPRYEILYPGSLGTLLIDFPCVMKTEFSANSAAVEFVSSVAEAEAVFEDFTKRFGQRVFAEAWERHAEYTVAYLPTTTTPLVAPLEMVIRGDKKYIDRVAKADNEYLQFQLPKRQAVERLTKLTHALAEACQIDGHFRVDVLENAEGQLFPIDLNLLPWLSAESSYFPIALNLRFGLTFPQVVAMILDYTAAQRGIRFSDEVNEALSQNLERQS
jgi:D-alanine-D-alanine ligase-like ATP-grasp enzyme